jgi:hypothetical protein
MRTAYQLAARLAQAGVIAAEVVAVYVYIAAFHAKYHLLTAEQWLRGRLR